MKSLKSIIKVAAVAVAAVTMSGTLTSCDVVAESLLDAALTPDYVVTYHSYDTRHHYEPVRPYKHHVSSYHSAPSRYEHVAVVSHRR